MKTIDVCNCCPYTIGKSMVPALKIELKAKILLNLVCPRPPIHPIIKDRIITKRNIKIKNVSTAISNIKMNLIKRNKKANFTKIE